MRTRADRASLPTEGSHPAGAPVRALTKEEARRIAVRAQLLDADRPADLASVVERLTLLQLDPTAVIAPAADLVAWSRLGDAYQPTQLVHAVERDRTLVELQGQPTPVEPVLAIVRPMADLALHLAEMEAARTGEMWHSGWVTANDGFRRRLLDQLRAEGPLSSRQLPDSCEVPWTSSGWTNDRNVTKMLELLARRGEVAVAARRGRERLWDVAERIHPAGLTAVPADEARRIRNERWLKALGVARPRVVGDAGVPASIEGTAGEWRLDPDATAEGFRGRTVLLSPFDRLTHDRARALELFEFEYTLEMYKPKHQRRWGYFALPVLHGDRMVGKVDATADRKQGALLVHAVHLDTKATKALAAAIDGELAALAGWLGLAEVRHDAPSSAPTKATATKATATKTTAPPARGRVR